MGRAAMVSDPCLRKRNQELKIQIHFFFLNDIDFSLDSEVQPLHLEGLQSCLRLPLVDKQAKGHIVRTCLRSHSN